MPPGCKLGSGLFCLDVVPIQPHHVSFLIFGHHFVLDPEGLRPMMNSMVLTSGEVTGLSQDRVSKQDAVAGKHKKQVVVTDGIFLRLYLKSLSLDMIR